MIDKEKRDEIFSLLQKNARLSSTEIAERLQLSKETVETLIKDAEDRELIHGYYTLFDSSAMAAKVRAIIEVKVRPERDRGFEQVATRISKFPEVTDVTLISGGYDLSLVVIGDTLQEVADFVATKLAPIDGIIEHSTHFVLRKYKEAGFCLQKDEEFKRLSVAP